MRQGGVSRAFFILRKGKWDIPQYYGNGAAIGMDLGYLVMGRPYGPPYTLDAAYPFVRGARIAFGFPDILFGPRDAFARALERLAATRADLVLGLYRVLIRGSLTWSRLTAAARARVGHQACRDKAEIGLGIRGMDIEVHGVHARVSRGATDDRRRPGIGLPAELTVGQVIQAAISEGLVTQSVIFPRRTYLDIGTPDNLIEAVRGSAIPL